MRANLNSSRGAGAPTDLRSMELTGRVAALLLVVSCGLVLIQIGDIEPPLPKAAKPAQAWPGELTAGERAAVNAALGSTGPRGQSVALEVAAGEAGALALGDPSVLHHHGVNTGRR
jgi:hypothetical protein